LATTQFQATGARYAFPNYDEPGFKATFQLTIYHNKTNIAISNTPIEVEKISDEDEELMMTKFEKTPKMSSYLLAFIVSEFDYATNEGRIGASDTKHRVYAQPEFKSKLDFAVDRSFEFLKIMEIYFDVPYELKKMYSAAIPDFAAGAMENWGLITYKEQYLIVDDHSHHREKFDSMRVIAHELGHQFFGNLVTCKWWDETWLNEGFATVMEFFLVQKVYPGHRFNDFFNIQRLQSAFITDAVETTHPMTFYGNRNTRIVYDKCKIHLKSIRHFFNNIFYSWKCYSYVPICFN
jgi:aminopeptidase N